MEIILLFIFGAIVSIVFETIRAALRGEDVYPPDARARDAEDDDDDVWHGR